MAITLKAARVNAGLTQGTAAKLIGVPIGTLRNWENYRTTPNVKYVGAILNTYGVQYEQVIFVPLNNT